MKHPDTRKIQRILNEAPGGTLLFMATGSGKTHSALQLIERSLNEGKRAIYITPLRAQAEELLQSWSEKFKEFDVGIYTGDYTDTKLPVAFKDAQLLIMTPERLDACTRFWRNHWGWIPHAELLVIDELHLLGDGYRGGRLEGAISRYRRLNPFVRIVGLSATLGNPEQISEWLQIKLYQSKWRSIPLEWEVIRFKNAQEKLPLLASELNTTQARTLVFVQSRRRAEQVSKELSLQGINSSYHHAGLTKQHRLEIETSFRDQKLDALVTTPTLEMGVNLPAGHVVLYDLQQFNGESFQPLSCISAWQRAGRAGRPGLDTQGKVTLIAAQWDKHANNYADGQFENIESGLKRPSVLAEQIVAEVSAGYAKTEKQLLRNLSFYFGSQQKLIEQPKAIIQQMISAKMLIEVIDENNPQNGLMLRATRLGRIACRHMLMPSTINTLQNCIVSYQNLTIFDFLLLACATEDCRPVIPIDWELLERLNDSLNQQNSLLLQLTPKDLSSVLGLNGKRLLNALSMACILQNRSAALSDDEISAQWDCYPFEIQQLTESLVRLLQAIKACEDPDIEANPQPEGLPLKQKLNVIETMITHGLTEASAMLTLIEGVGPKLAARLCHAGFKDIEDLSLADADAVSKIKGVSVSRAKKWIEIADDFIDTRGRSGLEEWSIAPNIEHGKNALRIDPYRLMRAMELKVKPARETGLFNVTGGADPHIVRFRQKKYLCDCADFNKGHICKHIIKVRMYYKEPKIMELKRQLEDQATIGGEQLNLTALWQQGTQIEGESWR